MGEFLPLTEALRAKHKRGHFTCGEPALDIYLKQFARQDQKRRVAAVFVLADAANRIQGYYTLSAAHISSEILPESLSKKLPKHSFQPATLLGRLAVDQAFQNQGMGETLLMDALHRSFLLSDQIGSIAVIVDALNKKAAKFYTPYGFIPLTGSKRLFLPIQTIAKLF